MNDIIICMYYVVDVYIFLLQELIVLRAIRDVNVPNFLVEDLKLFSGIVSDLFPNIKWVSCTLGRL